MIGNKKKRKNLKKNDDDAMLKKPQVDLCEFDVMSTKIEGFDLSKLYYHALTSL